MTIGSLDMTVFAAVLGLLVGLVLGAWLRGGHRHPRVATVLEDHRKKLEKATTAQQEAERKLEELSLKLPAMEGALETASSSLAELKAAREGDAGQVEAWKRKHDDLLGDVKAKNRLLGELQTNLNTWKQKARQLEAELQAGSSGATTARPSDAAAPDPGSEDGDELEIRIGGDGPPAEGVDATDPQVLGSDEELWISLGSGDSQASSSADDVRPAILMPAPDGEPDDLKEIRGIGPAIERSLNEIGIYHFRQIAALSADDVDWLAGHLPNFPQRIARDRWVEQASDLDSGGAG